MYDNSLLLNVEEMSLVLEPFLKYLSRTISKSQYEDLMKEKLNSITTTTITTNTITNSTPSEIVISFSGKGKKSFLKNMFLMALPTIIIKKLNRKWPSMSTPGNTLLYTYFTVLFFYSMVNNNDSICI